MSRKPVYLISLIVAAGFVPMGRAAGADPNLVGWWRFDEGAGTVAADSSGRGIDGVLLNDPVWRADGARGGCLFFDGYDAYVRIAQQDLLNPGAGSFTVLFWSNIEPTPGTRGDTAWDLAVNKRDTGSIGYYIGAQRTQGGGAGMTGYRFMLGDTSANRKDTPFVPVPLGEWVFMAVVLDRAADAQKISVDGGQNWAATTPPPGPIAPVQDLAVGWDIGPNNYWFHGRIDEVALFNRALSASEVGLIMAEGMTPGLAAEPQPQDGAADVPVAVTLGWEPGRRAASHDVYVGTSQADVEAADRAQPLGVLVSQGQGAASLSLDSLAFGQTYYWRVDEVNAPPDATIFKGDIWRFTVEPVAYPLDGGHIMATAASASGTDGGPAATIDGSGLDADDRHSVDTTEMWLSGAVPAGASAWIQYEFDQVYSLHQMLVWNHNAMTELLVGFGIKDATVEYSLDGSAWTPLGAGHTFAQASGQADYAANTTIAFGGAAARFVRITAVSNWGGILPQFGLSEVRFLYVPTAAREPSPASGATDLHPQVTLAWRPGRQAARHEVYLGTDPQPVRDGTAPVTAVTEPRFDAGALELGRTYYWKVDEVNDADAVPVWEGDLWSFATQPHVVVDDFESYTSDEGNRVYEIWIDGWENQTGSQVGYLDAPFVDQLIVHGDRQSMPLTYSNAAAPFISEAERTFATPQDWTRYGITTLTVYFRGALGNTGQLYLKIDNTKVPYTGAGDGIAGLLWRPWNIDLSTVGGDLTNVRKLTIGVEGADAAGILYIDDILLGTAAPAPVTAVEPDSAGLVAHYAFEGNLNDSSPKGLNGVLGGAPTYVAGVRGQALEFDGSDDHVRVAQQDPLNPATGSFTFAFWAKLDPTAGTSGATNWDLAVAKRDTGSNGYYVGADRNQGSAQQAGFKLMLGDTAARRVDTPFVLVPLGEWVPVAAVLDRGQNVHRISVDGGQTWATATPPAGPIAPVEDLGIGWDIGQNNYWFHGMIDEVRLYNRALSDAEIAWLAGGR